jgi:hypothetical protein
VGAGQEGLSDFDAGGAGTGQLENWEADVEEAQVETLKF